MVDKNIIKEVFRNQFRILAFKDITPNMKKHGNYYLVLVILTSLIAGVGRYWDNPRAELFQYLGLGSVVYIFTFSFILWLFILPLKPTNWSYKNVLIFVGMTSLPAVLYAIPVERFFTMPVAASMNVWFLAIVAIWRVALLVRFLNLGANLNVGEVLVAAFLPITFIVTALTALNLEHVVFNIMAGIAPEDMSANDAVYNILLIITTFSVIASPIFFLIYLGMIVNRRKNKSRIIR